MSSMLCHNLLCRVINKRLFGKPNNSTGFICTPIASNNATRSAVLCFFVAHRPKKKWLRWLLPKRFSARVGEHFVALKTFTQFLRGLHFSALQWFPWHFWAWNAFFSICFSKSCHPFWGSLFARHTSVSISDLAGTTPNSSAGTSASQSHLCPGPPNPTLPVNLSLSASSVLFASHTLQTHS